jgi:hypothetical protein
MDPLCINNETIMHLKVQLAINSGLVSPYKPAHFDPGGVKSNIQEPSLGMGRNGQRHSQNRDFAGAQAAPWNCKGWPTLKQRQEF